MIEIKIFKNIINNFRNMCLGFYKKEIKILPKHRLDNRIKIIHYNPELNAEIVPGTEDLFDLIHKIITTPRELKNIFRRTWRAWESLHGEIDFDDLLVCNVIRYSNPRAFNFILINIEKLRRGDSKDQIDELINDKKEPSFIQKIWEEYFDIEKWKTSNIYKLIEFLFPLIGDNYDEFYERSNQRVQYDEFTDYWRRLLLEELEPRIIRDQEVLTLVEKIKTNKFNSQFRRKAIHNQLYNSETFSQKFEQFATNKLDSKQIRLLSSNLFRTILKSERFKARTFDTNGFMELSVISNGIKHLKEEYENWFLLEMKKALPISILFARGLFSEWHLYSDHRSKNWEEENKSISVRTINIAKKVYDKPAKLIKALNDEYPTTLKYFIDDISMFEKQRVIEYKQWQWLGKLLLESIQKNHRITPFVTNLIFDIISQSPRKPYKYEFSYNEKHANGIFGNGIKNILEIISNSYNYTTYNTEKDRQFMEYYIKKSNDILKQLKT